MLGHVMLSGENVSMMVIVYALVNAVVSVITVNRLATTLHTEILLAGKKVWGFLTVPKSFTVPKRIATLILAPVIFAITKNKF